ncbi:hypothetical protein L204_102462 [Cryptococcus depauperatus]|nr:hypothetical protein L204_00791 [Cryptococcus depauperatus CBS 7855]
MHPSPGMKGSDSEMRSSLNPATSKASSVDANDKGNQALTSSANDSCHDETTGQLSDKPVIFFTPSVLIHKGMFSGKHMRFSLTVEQEPISGRRKTEKNRRPLGPAPIIRLRMVECKESEETGYVEEEIDPGTLEGLNFVCVADICQTDAENAILSASHAPFSSTVAENLQSIVQTPGIQSPSSKETVAASAGPGPSTLTYRAGVAAGDSQDDEKHEGADDSDRTVSENHLMKPTPAASSNAKPNAVAAKTRNLFGNLHVSGVRVTDLQGQMGMWFIFTDLCIRQEGRYSLRFRCFDITSVDPDGQPSPQLAECISRPFQIYSPRSVPPLPKPTLLAEHFAQQGFKLSSRNSERALTFPVPPGPNDKPVRPILSSLQPVTGGEAPREGSGSKSTISSSFSSSESRFGISASDQSPQEVTGHLAESNNFKERPKH